MTTALRFAKWDRFRSVGSIRRTLTFVAFCVGMVAFLGSVRGDDTALETENEAISKGSAISKENAERLIADLGAPTFARREQAIGDIVRAGDVILPFLRDAAGATSDPEIRLRVERAIDELTMGNFESRVAKFLTRQDDGDVFEGWLTVAETLGDNRAVREVFVEIMRTHPDLIASLDRSTRERSLAADQTAQAIQTKMFRDLPTLADGIALLLPLVDPNVRTSGGYEDTVLRVFQMQMASLRRDALLWPTVAPLLDKWVQRARIEKRAKVLWNAMQWDLESARTLGIQTLGETTDIEALQLAMQAIARFGDKKDAPILIKYIEDPRPAATGMAIMLDNDVMQVTLGDVAMAAIAVLYEIPLEKLGMTQGELHPRIAFIVDGTGYFAQDPELRSKAQATVRGWLAGAPPVE